LHFLVLSFVSGSLMIAGVPLTGGTFSQKSEKNNARRVNKIWPVPEHRIFFKLLKIKRLLEQRALSGCCGIARREFSGMSCMS
jgi:hypothetical protein